MNVEQACERLKISPAELFRKAYQRHGLMFSVGGPNETYPRWQQHGTIPVYVARFLNDTEKIR